jgi:N-acetylglutamate synthase-like GNAT family acetyltransferase
MILSVELIYHQWLCSLYIESDYRGKALGSILIDKVKEDAKKEHFKAVYLCIELDGYYEKYDFHYFGVAYMMMVNQQRFMRLTLNNESNHSL